MKMLRQLPQLLRFIPGTAQDVRTYFLALQYWLAGSEENLANLVRMLVGRYATGAAPRAAGTLRAAAPVDYPDVGLYHPRSPGRIVERLRARCRCRGVAGTVGLLLLRSYVLAGNAGPLRRRDRGARGARPAGRSRPSPAGSTRGPAIEAYFMRDGVAAVDAVVSLTGFSLVGGPAYNDAAPPRRLLAQLDVPYVAAHPVEFQTLEQWEADAARADCRSRPP